MNGSSSSDIFMQQISEAFGMLFMTVTYVALILFVVVVILVLAQLARGLYYILTH